MTYTEEIQALENPTFRKIKNIAHNSLDHLSQQERTKLWEQLDHGVNLLDSHELLCQYLCSYGTQHDGRIKTSLSSINNPQQVFDRNFSIIDWGCGQGLATICFFDFLKQHNISNKTQKVILIEPSKMALERAKLHTNAYLKDENKIQIVNKFLDNVEKSDIVTNEPVILHFFSNILDIPYINLEKLSQLINQNIKGEQYFFCVCPLNYGNDRVDNFYNCLNSYAEQNEDKFQLLAEDSYQKDTQRSYSLKLKVFKIERNIQNTTQSGKKIAGGNTGKLTWAIYDDTLVINSKGAMPDYNSPSPPWSSHQEVNTSPWNLHREAINTVFIEEGITNIGKYAFRDCLNLTSITIPNSVISIGDSAFQDCNKLTSIIIPNSVTTIGCYAFSRCSSLDSVMIPDSVTQIEHFAFSGCSSLTSIYLPNNITRIKGRIFSGCNRLNSIEIPNSVISIEFGAFEDCTSLTAITIPNSVTKIEGAFLGCSNLTSVTIPNSVTDIGVSAFYGCSRLTSIIIGNSVTSIGNSAFRDCSSLTSITIPDSVTTIGNSAFKGCSSLIYINIPAGVAWVNDNIFENCSNLISVSIPQNVRKIGESAFENCSSLTFINVPDSVTSIGSRAFLGCCSLISINIANNTIYTSENGILFNKVKTELIQYPEGKPDTKYIIPDSVTKIGDSAFNKCTNLVSVTIPNSVTTIGRSAFQDCNCLTSIVIPNSVTGIGYYAFKNCSNLTSIMISSSVTSIGNRAFEGCTNLISVDVEKNNTTYASENGVLFDKAKITLLLYPIGKIDTKYIIPNSVTNIGDFAFYQCTALICIIIGNNVTKIGNSAFNKCTNLVSVTISDSVTTIGWSAFRDCNCLTSIVIPNNVTKIGYAAFEGCNSLITTTGTNNVTNEYGALNLGIKKAGGSIFPLTWAIYEDTLIINGNGAISDYFLHDVGDLPEYYTPWHSYINSIARIIIGEGVTGIGDSAFKRTYHLTSITIPNSVIIIGEGAFGECENLTFIKIPDNVTSIGDWAFSDCISLKHIHLQSVIPPTIYDNTFGGIDKDICVLYVPIGSKDKYAEADDWKEFKQIQEDNDNEDNYYDKYSDYDESYTQGDSRYDRNENPWINVFGYGEEAETAYWNTD